MNILLTTFNSKYIHPNLALRLISDYANNIHKNTINITITEYTIKNDLNKILTEHDFENIDILGISTYIWNVEISLSFAKMINKQFPNITIVLGGPEVSYEPEEFLKYPYINYVFSGESEKSFSNFLSELKKEKPELSNVSGLHYRNKNNCATTSAPYIDKLDELANPYIKTPLINNQIAYIESSRGCPFTCGYCVAGLENKVRFFNLENTFEVIDTVISQGAKTIKFLDRTFNIKEDHMIKIMNYIISLNKKVSVQFELSPTLISKKFIDYLKTSVPKDLFRFEIGIQTTDNNVNKLVNRMQDYQLAKQNILDVIKTNKVDLHLDLIVGLPNESYENIISSFNDVFLLQGAELQLGFLKILRGTNIKKNADHFGYKYDSKAPYEVISNNTLTRKQIDDFKIVAHVIDKCYNLPRLKQSFEFILNNETTVKDNPFNFLLSFGKYFSEVSDFHRYQLDEIYTAFIDHIRESSLSLKNDIEPYIILDYYYQHKYKPKSIFAHSLTKKQRNEVLRNFYKKHSDFALNFLYKHAIIIECCCNPLDYKQPKNSGYLIIIYENQKPIFYWLNNL